MQTSYSTWYQVAGKLTSWSSADKSRSIRYLYTPSYLHLGAIVVLLLEVTEGSVLRRRRRKRRKVQSVRTITTQRWRLQRVVRASEGTAEASPIALRRQRIMTTAESAWCLNVYWHLRVNAHESNLFQGPELTRAFQQHKVEPKLSYHHTNHYSSKVRCTGLTG